MLIEGTISRHSREIALLCLVKLGIWGGLNAPDIERSSMSGVLDCIFILLVLSIYCIFIVSSPLFFFNNNYI